MISGLNLTIQRRVYNLISVWRRMNTTKRQISPLTKKQEKLNVITVNMPTINDTSSDFKTLFDIWSQVDKDDLSVIFDFSFCKFLRPNAVAFLGGLTRMIRYRSGTVDVRWNTLSKEIMTNLRQNGFYHCLSGGTAPWSGNSIPYREDLISQPDDFADYLRNQWIGRGWVNVSDALKDKITGRIYEIYANAFEHGASPIGVYACGQNFPSLGVLTLAIIDFGIGIPFNVKPFLNDSELKSDAAALAWAFMRGKSSKGRGRGLGLDLLKEFIRKNNGILEIYSENGKAHITRKEESYTVFNGYFGGTIVYITLQCDERFYYLASEANDEPLF